MQINSKLLTIVAKAQTAEVQKQVTAEVEKTAAETGVSSAAIDTTSIVDEILAKNKNATIYSIADKIAVGALKTKAFVDSVPVVSQEDVIAGNNKIGALSQKTFITAIPVSDTLVESTDIDDIGKDIAINLKIKSNLSVQFTGLSSSEISDIKQIIYDLHHPKTDSGDDDDDTPVTGDDDDDTPVTGDDDDTPVTGDDDDDTPVTGDDDDTPVTGDDDDDTPVTGDDDDTEETDDPKPSFIDEFDDVESMFDWLNEQDPSISQDTGITRAQLIELTQNDSWEDSNYDFFGSLNRIFDVLDKNDNDILTVDEIKELIGEEIGTSASALQSKVETFAEELQTEYESLSLQGKLEFGIEKTREYLEAAGLTAQLEALDRLLAGTDTYNSVHVGQIAFADLSASAPDGYITMGSYTSNGLQATYNGMNYTIYASDSDTSKNDLGLTLNQEYFANAKWYELVDTLVHELTHATAYQYSIVGSEGYLIYVSQDIIDALHTAGALTDDEYSYYTANIKTLMDEANARGEFNSADGNYTFSDEKLNRFFYLMYTMWGEYSAYQTDADYVDSIAGDEFDAGLLTTATDGPNEKGTIERHIESAYNNDGYVESEPDWTWWSYA